MMTKEIPLVTLTWDWCCHEIGDQATFIKLEEPVLLIQVALEVGEGQPTGWFFREWLQQDVFSIFLCRITGQ